MRKFDDVTRALIQQKISEVETRCDSELVCLVTRRSARYLIYPLLVAAILSLLLPVTEGLAGLAGFDNVPLRFEDQLMFFVLCALLFCLTPLRGVVTPRWLKSQNCQRYGNELFFRHHLHETSRRNGILVFVSWEERHVAIIADKGINDRVPQSAWDDLISDFVTSIKADDMATGFLSIIGGAGDLLIRHFPKDEPAKNELANHLIEVNAVPYVS